jgi:predicted DNA-binding transcriptional regulator YafY
MESIVENEAGAEVTFCVRQPEELLQWLLGWGAGIQVIAPQSLREKIRKEVVKMMNHY